MCLSGRNVARASNARLVYRRKVHEAFVQRPHVQLTFTYKAASFMGEKKRASGPLGLEIQAAPRHSRKL